MTASDRHRMVRPSLVGAAIVLALVGVGTAVNAQEGRPFLFLMPITVGPDLDPQVVCAGQTRELLASARPIVIGMPPYVSWFKTGFEEIAPTVTSSDRGIATITRNQAARGSYGVAERGFRYDLVGVKPGSTTITFKATKSGGYFGDQQDRNNMLRGIKFKPLKASRTVNVKVDDCDYKVSAVHTLSTPDWPDVVTAALEDVRVSADEDGRLTGTGDLEWTVRKDFRPACKGAKVRTSIKASGVDVTGEVDEDDGRVTMRFTYAPTAWSYVGKCPSGGGFDFKDLPIQLPPFSTVVAAEGGSIDVDRTFSPCPGRVKSKVERAFCEAFTFEDSAVIAVEPVGETAVAPG